jgi:hypothetical protein
VSEVRQVWVALHAQLALTRPFYRCTTAALRLHLFSFVLEPFGMSALPPKADIRRPAKSITLGQLGDELHVFLRRPDAASTGANIA